MVNISRALRLIWRAKLTVQKFILVFAAISLTGLIFTQVVSRYVFNTAIFGVEEIACYIAVWMYFIGASIGAEQSEHISASLVGAFVESASWQLAIKIFASVITVSLCIWMTVWAYKLASWSLRLGMMSTEINFPVGVAQLAMPVGLALMSLYFFVELIGNLDQWQRSRRKK